MKVFEFLALNLVVISLSACGGGSSSGSTESTVSYELEFKTNWSVTNFSTNFPSNRHFSGLIGLTHNSTVKIFEVGALASNGIVSMAETGSKGLLKSDIEDMQNQGNSGSTIDGQGIPAGLTSVSVIFDISQDHPLVSVVTMIAPSPDWFTGVSNIPLFVDGQWVEEIEIQLTSYDAGSDSGVTFTSANLATNPRSPITKLTTARADADFESGFHFLTSLSIGTFKLKKIN
ncbi:spondin domain-containing protein [uncultured Photobacterium sp.]|uniref:spondin domain-containing protein n=1 Tax=uncultured Photobacterium sp. TaxID=173973 RepID=UPI00262DE83D|nr:spondin domain-containing protein [uncultured Photobacterium sp.]